MIQIIAAALLGMVFGGIAGFALGGFCRQGKIYDAYYSGVADARLKTTGNGSKEKPFQREAHLAACAVYGGRPCDCAVRIALSKS